MALGEAELAWHQHAHFHRGVGRVEMLVVWVDSRGLAGAGNVGGFGPQKRVLFVFVYLGCVMYVLLSVIVDSVFYGNDVGSEGFLLFFSFLW